MATHPTAAAREAEIAATRAARECRTNPTADMAAQAEAAARRADAAAARARGQAAIDAEDAAAEAWHAAYDAAMALGLPAIAPLAR